MKKLGLFSTACLLVLSATTAQAATVFTDFYAPNGANGVLLCAQGQGTPCQPGNSPDSTSWVFDITDNGFNPATQSIASATIDLMLEDDNRDPRRFSLEFAKLTTGGVASDVFQVNTGTTTLEVLSLLTLNQNGTLDVTLTATQGDFYFIDATLNAVEDHAVVPVPAAAWLFGSGLLGLVGMARRRRV